MKRPKSALVGEIQVQKSPAEFFAENQSIAGFDNLGKSLYTSLRELVENGLDACESIQVLPNIRVDIVEYTQSEFNILTGVGESSSRNYKDEELFQKKGPRPRKSHSSTPVKALEEVMNDDLEETKDAKSAPATDTAESNNAETAKPRRRGAQDAYFQLTVRDNGCGMNHDAIPDLLGRVLSGSKYGVRQTRGKFGLGAKMALIWAKKSTGQPIRIQTTHTVSPAQPPPTHVSTCVLDIDIYRNTPRVLEHTKTLNENDWRGTEIRVLIAGNWTTYKTRIVQYMQQLAIITPYAELQLHYSCCSEPKRDLILLYERRSEQMPPPAKQVKHHPSSVNNLILQQLIRCTKKKRLDSFLATELAGVSSALAKRLLTELGATFDEDMDPQDLTDKQITGMVQLLRQVQMFKSPDGSCLSPLGEYNLNLGIQKVIEPDCIATARDKPGAYEGHPFVVEAAVSLGGNKNVKEGLTVVRFANRIPLLFEGGADVATRVAQTKIRWSSYKIDHKRDKVGVFISIVSTKIPFKGTSKEYIGDDATEIQQSVKRSLQICCQQLRVHLSKRNALKDAKERKARLFKYIPDVGRSLFGLLEGMRKRQADAQSESDNEEPTVINVSRLKRLRLCKAQQADMLRKLEQGEISDAIIRERLMESVDIQLETDDGGVLVQNGCMAQEMKASEADVVVPVYLIPLFNLDDNCFDVRGSGFIFRAIAPLRESC